MDEYIPNMSFTKELDLTRARISQEITELLEKAELYSLRVYDVELAFNVIARIDGQKIAMSRLTLNVIIK